MIEAADGARILRFWDKVDMSTPDQCWEWQAYRDRKGYGQFGLPGRRIGYSHRIAYALANGDLRDGQDECVLHRCDNPPCCNPHHLFVGSVADNNQDMRRKGRDARGPELGRAIAAGLPRGTKHHMARLTPEVVIRARRLKREGLSHTQVWERLRPPVTRAALADAIRGTTWTHIKEGLS